MDVDEQRLERIIEQVVKTVRAEQAAAPARPGPTRTAASARDGVFDGHEGAIEAAHAAFGQLGREGVGKRKAVIAAMRRAGRDGAREMAELACEETGMGRVDHKVLKNELAADATPGVEDLEAAVLSGDAGVTLHDLAPMGVVLAITPSTNPTSTVINNAISMVSAGNAVVFAPHPGAKDCTLRQMQLLNRAIVGAGGPANLLTSVAEPSLRTVVECMKHPTVDVICATGGAAVVRAALESGKKAICAGPGNPPVLVDETADLKKAARDIIEGAGLDNNIVCVCEKEIIAVEAIADDLVRELKAAGCHELTHSELLALSRILLDEQGRLNRDLVGRDAHIILERIGSRIPEDVRLCICETDEDHPLVQHEQLMPIIPILRVRRFAEGVELAARVEHGFGHTAIIHSADVRRITEFGRAMACTILVANAPSYAWTGKEGEGFLTMTIAGPTGEGLTRARHFTRRRHAVLGGSLRLV